LERSYGLSDDFWFVVEKAEVVSELGMREHGFGLNGQRRGMSTGLAGEWVDHGLD
jgi:hypothetical protein